MFLHSIDPLSSFDRWSFSDVVIALIFPIHKGEKWYNDFYGFYRLNFENMREMTA